MGEVLLKVEDLVVEAPNGKEILNGVNLEVGYGEIHVLFGPNGAGKTALISTIAGIPKYRIKHGKIIFKGEDITNLPLYERVKRGIALSFQIPPVIKGLKLKDYLLSIAKNVDGENVSEEKIIYLAEKLKLKEFLDRDVNVGFSGGEKKRSEVLQLLLLKPELSLIDEPESGVDVENMNLIGETIKELLEIPSHHTQGKERKKSAIIITHTGYILNYVPADKGYIFVGGKIVCSSNPYDIFEYIQKNGFKLCEEQCARKQ